jgi:hypothetical protein
VPHGFLFIGFRDQELNTLFNEPYIFCFVERTGLVKSEAVAESRSDIFKDGVVLELLRTDYVIGVTELTLVEGNVRFFRFEVGV